MNIGGSRIASGLDVGLQTGEPQVNQIRIGDPNFALQWNGTNPSINFDLNDRLLYDSGEDAYLFDIAGTTEMQLTSQGVRITNGLHVGSANGTLVDNSAIIEGGLTIGATATPPSNGLLVADDRFGLLGGNTPELRFDAGDGIRYSRSDNRLLFSVGGQDVLAIKQSSLNGTQLFNQRRSDAIPFLEDTTSGTLLRNSLSVTGSNANGTVVIGRNTRNNAPNLRLDYNGGFSPGGKALVIDTVGFVSARRAHMNLRPLQVSGPGTFPDTDVRAGDIFVAGDFNPARMYFYNGNSWIQVA